MVQKTWKDIIEAHEEDIINGIETACYEAVGDSDCSEWYVYLCKDGTVEVEANTWYMHDERLCVYSKQCNGDFWVEWWEEANEEVHMTKRSVIYALTGDDIDKHCCNRAYKDEVDENDPYYDWYDIIERPIAMSVQEAEKIRDEIISLMIDRELADIDYYIYSLKKENKDYVVAE